ncbi:hypothetical protein CC1G_01478 [Coprinopsis cinerea okayama7|uniref:Uncharacterized protein n=1 Tax=Coprinopsis cinerea (strain Okayama-7 / 130 / ATCC MYA-4618 / FGSC 9003) TaxID=240176 RepID=A8NHQ0_COPC7|nr:hypothetical protein CC1G_01478 [Coprinopsis cinerea okayama7\|eukprot:XP_001833801.2 hypothetical protein CC1G_01478 [Coprinopsis cinerea okayama7\
MYENAALDSRQLYIEMLPSGLSQVDRPEVSSSITNFQRLQGRGSILAAAPPGAKARLKAACYTLCSLFLPGFWVKQQKDLKITWK